MTVFFPLDTAKSRLQGEFRVQRDCACDPPLSPTPRFICQSGSELQDGNKFYFQENMSYKTKQMKAFKVSLHALENWDGHFS